MGAAKLKNGIHIRLDNPTWSYCAGELIKGWVIAKTDKPTKVKEITLLLQGTASVKWKENDIHTQNHSLSSIHSTETGRYVSQEKYMDSKLILAVNGQTSITIREGVTVYPFEFILPESLPSSFTSKNGTVTYFLEAEMKLPFSQPRQKITIPLKVNGIFDLNLELRTVQLVKSMSIFYPSRGGHIGFVLTVLRPGFVPGERVNFIYEITNTGNKRVESMKASIIRRTRYYARNGLKHKTVEKTVYEMKSPVYQGLWSPTNFLIPSLVPTGLGGTCSIIDVMYFLRVYLVARSSSSRRTLFAQLPIVIGTIPFRNTFDNFSRTLNGQRMGFQDTTPATVPPNLPSSSSHTPNSPSYQEVTLYEPVNLIPSSSVAIVNGYSNSDPPPPTYDEAIMKDMLI